MILSRVWFCLVWGAGVEPHNNYLIFTGMPFEIYWNEWKDFVYQKERRHHHLGKLIGSSLKQNIWRKKTLNQQTPKLKFLLF